MNLKDKTIAGLIWSFIDNFSSQGINFIFGIILARILSPKEFGLIGIVTIFIAISQSFIDSGFSQALIRKKECTIQDYSTIFIFNTVLGLITYAILFFCAGSISVFFQEPQLELLVQVIGLSLILNAFTIIQKTQLTKRLDFKLQTKISIISSLVSGISAIIMAFGGYGIWSLVAKTLLFYFFYSALLWFWSYWRPKWIFNIASFNELFSFGYKLLLSGLIDTLYRNVYYLVIGKYFSAVQLGYFTRADQFQYMPSQNITMVIQRVSFPVLSTIQDDTPKLKSSYQKLIKSTMLISFILMIGMAAVAKPMVITLIGEKWLPCVVYLQLLCFVGMLLPLHALNLNMLNVQGRSDLFLRLEIIKKILAIPVVILGIMYGIEVLIIGMLVHSIGCYFLNGYWSGKFIGYSVKNQIIDILPAFILALFVNSLVYLAGILIEGSPAILLFLQIFIGIVLTIGICEILKFRDYLYIKNSVLDRIHNMRK